MTLNTIARTPLVMRVDLPEQADTPDDTVAPRPMLHLLDDVSVTVDIRLGSAALSVKDLMAMRAGSVLELDRHVHDTVDICLNHKVVARAEIVAVGENFGVRVTDILAGPQ